MCMCALCAIMGMCLHPCVCMWICVCVVQRVSVSECVNTPPYLQCTKKHVLVCPDFSQSGSCPRGSRCPLKHRKPPKREAHEVLLLQIETFSFLF